MLQKLFTSVLRVVVLPVGQSRKPGKDSRIRNVGS